MSQKWEAELLAQLDQAVENFTFPGLPNEYHAFAKMRLTAFRGPEEWLLVFEVLSWARREAELQNTVSAFGNRIAQPGLQSDPAVVKAVGGGSLFDGDGRFLLAPSDFEVEVGGERRHFHPSRPELKAAKLNEPMEPAAKVIRYLAATLPDQLFFPDAKLLEICGRQGQGLERLLQVGDWHLPDPVEGERPSELPGFVSLAAGLSSGDAKRYSCPQKTFNTQWSNWD